MSGWAKKPIDRMEMYDLLAKIYIQTSCGFGEMGLADFIKNNGGETIKAKHRLVSKVLVRSGLLTRRGEKGWGVAYKWNLKEYGPVSIPIAEQMIAETEHLIRVEARVKYQNKKKRDAERS